MSSTWRTNPQSSDSSKLDASFVETVTALVDRSAVKRNAILSLYLKAGAWRLSFQTTYFFKRTYSGLWEQGTNKLWRQAARFSSTEDSLERQF